MRFGVSTRPGQAQTSPQIGRRLFVATTTVDSHRRKIMHKLGIHNVADLTKYAVREGLTPLDS